MAMSKKDFQLIANVVRNEGGENREALAKAFAIELRATNPRFDRDRFIAACLPEPEDIITVHGFERLTNSSSNNPRYKLFCDGGTLLTSSDASFTHGFQNGWTVGHITKAYRNARVTRTKAGRIATLVWLDGDN